MQVGSDFCENRTTCRIKGVTLAVLVSRRKRRRVNYHQATVALFVTVRPLDKVPYVLGCVRSIHRVHVVAVLYSGILILLEEHVLKDSTSRIQGRTNRR